MSGRLTPAAATLTSTSSGARLRHRPFDQPQILRAVGRRRDHGHHRCGDARHGAALIDLAGQWSTIPTHGSGRPFPSKPGDPLVELAKQDLDPMSIEELEARIEALKAEIVRVETHMERVESTARRPKSCSKSPNLEPLNGHSGR